MTKKNPIRYDQVNLEETVAYEIPSISATDWGEVVYEKGVTGDWIPIVGGETSKAHAIYRISLAVANTNRAAMAEYLLVMRPDPRPTYNGRAYQYLERTAVVHNQVGSEDINTPVLFFDSKAGNILKVKLAGMPDKQIVLVNITRVLNRTVSRPTRRDLGYARNA